MNTEARAAAKRLDAYHSKLGTDEETDYPEGFDPADDAKLVREALGA